MTTMVNRNKQLAQAIAQDIAANANNIGNLTNLITVSKGNLVAAINELKSDVSNYALMSEIENGPAQTGKAWSSLTTEGHISDAKALAINTAQTALDTALAGIQSQIAGLNGVDSSYATQIQSLLTALQSNDAADLLTKALAMKAVRYDIAQNLTAGEKTIARSNIGAISAQEVVDAYGDPDYDTSAFYALSVVAARAGTALPAL